MRPRIEPYSEWEIEECIDCLEHSARDVGDTHSAIMVQAGRGPTPNAYRATNSWHAIEIIRSLQAQILKLQGNEVKNSE